VLSGGQRRRLDLALALVGRPDLVFLDEPTTGFDPGARQVAWRLVRDLRAEGVTVVLTTHYMEEAHALADRVAILLDGRIVANGPPDALVDDDVAEIRFHASGHHVPSAFAASIDDRGMAVIRTTTPTVVLRELTRRGVELHHLSVRRPTLEDIYLRLTGTAEDA
jgi:ABC-2 type transport system ATP-binding protein